jgi:predicted alpha/beta superfamily hydrolase
MRTSTLLLASLLVPTALAAQGADRYRLTIGTVDSLKSTVLSGETRKYLVYTPPSYSDTLYTPQRYPVLYLLDGDAHFHSVTGLIQILGTGVNATYAIPEMIVVAIPNTNRMRDMSPTKVTTGLDGKHAPGMASSGGMGNFLSMIKTELIPAIDGKFRTLPYRVFVGHSLGGITVIQALYTMPETFNAYVAIDPSLWWDNKVLLRQAKDHLNKADYYKGKSLFLGQANTMRADDTTTNQHFNAMLQFNEVVREYNTSGLRFGYKYYPDDDHGSVPLITEYDALRFIFDGYRVNLGRALASPSYLPEHYKKVSAELGVQLQPSEAMISQLAGFAVGQDTAKAIQFYELAAQMYPRSFRSFDRLGVLYAAKGEKSKAIDNLQKSLALNPNNGLTANKLKQLQGQ